MENPVAIMNATAEDIKLAIRIEEEAMERIELKFNTAETDGRIRTTKSSRRM